MVEVEAPAMRPAVAAQAPVYIEQSAWGKYNRSAVRVEGKGARATADKGEFIVLGRLPRNRLAHHWEVLLRKKQPGTPLSIGIAVDLDDSELSRGAQDTHFKDRIWHYCNNDGSFRNGGFQVGTKSQGQKLMYATGDRIDVYFDVDAGELKFAKNGQMLDGVISDIVDKKHLQDIENAKDAGEEPPAGVGNFYLMVSLGSGDFVEVAESPLELTYQYPEATYKWWDREPDNCPSLVAGTPPFFYSVDRELPAGLTIDEKTGIISGIATGKKDIDQAGWRELCIQMYMGKISERGWAKARAALMRELGSNLTDRELKLRSRALFKKFDSDGSGEIDLGELRDAMASIRVILTDSELEHMLADLDVDGSASIGMVEFEAVMDKMYNSKEKHSLWKSAGFALKKKLGAQLDVKIELPNKCREIFKEFDADGSGRIDIEEMCEALGKLGVAVTHDECDEMLDQAGIDQGSGDDVGVDFPSWQNLINMIYTGGDESLWEKAKKGIIEMLGPNLTEEELWDRADKVFAKLDTDKSGYLDLDELGEAMTNIGIQVQDDDLARMIDESDVHGKLWRVTVKNRLGEWGFTLKMTVREGVSELAYTSQDVFCRLGDKFTPLKVARLRGASPFEFEIDPPLPVGMSIDVKTGTIMGRPVAESPRTMYTITASNGVGKTTGQVEIAVIVGPTELKMEYQNTIYKAGQLGSKAWGAARQQLLVQLGAHVTEERLYDMAMDMFDGIDEDGSGEVDVSELMVALETWGVTVTRDEAVQMISECTGASAEDVEGGKGIGDEEFHKVVAQIYMGFKSGADRFKTDPTSDWVANEHRVLSIEGTPKFIFAVEPELPEGLVMDVETGSITGVPMFESRQKEYTISAKNRAGKTSATFTIEVLEPPSDLVYHVITHKLVTYTPIEPIKATVKGTKDAVCGLMKFEAGRDPVQAREAFDRFDVDGSGELDIDEMKAMMEYLGVVMNDEEIMEVMDSMDTGGGGLDGEEKDYLVSFDEYWRYFSSGLPDGLSFNDGDGLITGIPTKGSPPGIYTMVAFNAVGETSVTIALEVLEPPTKLAYSCPRCIYQVGSSTFYRRLDKKDIDPNTLDERGEAFESNRLSYVGTKVTFSIHPALPHGLEMDPMTGEITGTPTQTTVTGQSAKVGYTDEIIYTVSGRNDVAEGSVQFSLEVCQPPTVLKYKRVKAEYLIGDEIIDNDMSLCDGTKPYRFSCSRDYDKTKAIFDKYDKDGGGSLDYSEFRTVIRDLGEKMPERELRWLLTHIDKDRSGVIEFEEFWEWYAPLPYGIEIEEDTGTIYGRPLRECEMGTWIVRLHNKVGHIEIELQMCVLDALSSREREADKRRQYWYDGKRVMLYPNGNRYEGEWQRGKYWGQGKLTRPDGYEYEGGWRKGKQHGKGKEKFADCLMESYEGEYFDGVRHGKGLLKWLNGDSYEGEFANGKREGIGKMTVVRDGRMFIYEGEWERDKQHGKASVMDMDGLSYTVVSRHGAIVSQGSPEVKKVAWTFSDESTFEGETQPAAGIGSNEVMIHGEGKRSWLNGDKYEGEFRFGKRDGQGAFTWSHGDRYEGGWKDGTMHGLGILRQGDASGIVWHERGQLESFAPVARIPVTTLDEHTLGVVPWGAGSRGSRTLGRVFEDPNKRSVEGDCLRQPREDWEERRIGDGRERDSETSLSMSVTSSWGRGTGAPTTRSVLVGFKDGTRVGEEYARLSRAHDSILRGVRRDIPVWDASMTRLPSPGGSTWVGEGSKRETTKLPEITSKFR